MYASYEQHSRGTRDNTATCTYVCAHVHSIQLSSLVSHAGPVCDEESLFLGWEYRGQHQRSKNDVYNTVQMLYKIRRSMHTFLWSFPFLWTSLTAQETYRKYRVAG